MAIVGFSDESLMSEFCALCELLPPMGYHETLDLGRPTPPDPRIEKVAYDMSYALGQSISKLYLEALGPTPESKTMKKKIKKGKKMDKKMDKMKGKK